MKNKRLTHFRKYKNRAIMGGKAYVFSIWKIAISSFLMFIGYFCYLYSLFTLAPLIYQMLLGTGIIFTPILSRIFLKKTMYKHTFVGITISSISLLLIIFSSVFFDYSRAGSELFELEAILLMILGVFVMSCC